MQKRITATNKQAKKWNSDSQNSTFFSLEFWKLSQNLDFLRTYFFPLRILNSFSEFWMFSHNFNFFPTFWHFSQNSDFTPRIQNFAFFSSEFRIFFLPTIGFVSHTFFSSEHWLFSLSPEFFFSELWIFFLRIQTFF